MTHETSPSVSRSHLRFWLAGIVFFFLFLYLIRSILLPFVVGLLAAYFLDPAVRKLHPITAGRALKPQASSLLASLLSPVFYAAFHCRSLRNNSARLPANPLLMYAHCKRNTVLN